MTAASMWLSRWEVEYWCWRVIQRANNGNVTSLDDLDPHKLEERVCPG